MTASMVCRVHYSAFALLLLTTVVSAGEPSARWRIETSDRQKIDARIRYEIHTTSYLVTRWLAFMPEPPELPSQTVAKVTGTPNSKVVEERSPIARKVRLVDLPVSDLSLARKLQLDLYVQATLRARRLVALKNGETSPKVVPLTQAEQKYYTSAGTSIDFNVPSFKNWLDKKQLHPKKGELPMQFAERVLEVIRSDYKYKFTVGEKRASIVCDQPTGDCSCMSYIFVGAMRASDIPSRMLVGRFAKPRKEGVGPSDNQYDQPHVRCEFYLKDVGWVPVDPAFANGNKVKKVRDFIGNDLGDVLVLYVDIDLQLPFPDKVRPSPGMQTHPAYWAFGKGKFDGEYGDTGWELTATPIAKTSR